MQNAYKLNLQLVKEKMVKKMGRPMTNLDIAKELGCSHTTLYNWQKGVNTERLEAISKMLEITGLEFNQVFKKN